MAVITLDYNNTLKEATANDGTVEGRVLITLTESTFAGTDGQALPGATVDNVPTGLTAALVRTSDTTATLTLTGKADAHDDDITNLKVTLTEDSFDSGAVLTDVNLVKDNLLIDFDAPAGGGSEPPAPFSGPLFIASVEELAAGAGGDPTIGTAGKVKLTGYAATPDSIITIFNGSKKVEGTVNLNKDTGVWTFETPSLDKAGVYNFTAKETFIDNSGTKEKTLYGGPSNTLTYTVDTKAPPTPKVDKFKLPTANTTPTITGKAEKFAEVEVFAKLGEAAAVSLGKVLANDKGIWSLQVENALADGAYALTATATDAAGNKSADATKTETLTIDTQISGETGFTITAGKGLQYSTAAGVTANTWATKKLSSQKFEGKAEANSVIQFFGGPDGSVPLGKPVKVNKNGDWKATLKLTDGEHVISALVTDQAGNQKTFAATADGDIGAAVGLGTIKVDSFAPIATVKKETATPTTLSGFVEHDAVEVEVFAGKISLGKVTTGLEDGTWELAVPGTVTGKQKITVTATDAAGNVSKPSAGVTYDFTEAAGGGGGTFTVTVAAGVVDFGGTATGDITVTNDAGTLTFTRGGTAAETKPAIADLAADGIPTTATLVMDTAVFTAIDDKLADTAVVTLNDTTRSFLATDLVTIGTHTATATFANSQTINNATVDSAIAALVTEATKVVMATGTVATVDLFADSTFTAAELTSVYGALGGTVIGTAADTITVTTLNGATVAATESIDTFVFGATDTGVGITDFTFGAGGDMLDVSAFINATLAAELNVALSANIDATGLNVLGVTNLRSPISNNFGDTANISTIKTTANQKLFLVADDINDSTDSQGLYYVTTDASNVATVTLVGTINPGTLHEENFITA